MSHYIPTRRTGAEKFQMAGKDLAFQLQDFWQWSVSDLVSNLTRGRLAEYIVAKACDIPTTGIRAEWDPCDLVTADGVKIEVKCGAHLQSWKQNAPSTLRFQVPETFAWSATEGKFDKECKRQADVYVFAILAHKDPATLNPLDLDQWQFYVLPTEELNKRNRRSISFRILCSLCNPIPFHELGIAVTRLGLKLPPEVGDLIITGVDGIHRMKPPGPNIFDCR